MFLMPPGRRMEGRANHPTNQLVGLNREIIQTGWGIGDPLPFARSTSRSAPSSETASSAPMNITDCIADFAAVRLPRSRQEGSRLEANVIPDRYTLPFVKRCSFCSPPFTLPPTSTVKDSFSAVDRWLQSVGGGNGGISSLDSPFFLFLESLEQRSSVHFPMKPPFVT